MSQAASPSRSPLRIAARWIILSLLALAGLAAALSYRWWLPPVQRLAESGLASLKRSNDESSHESDDHDHAGHDHADDHAHAGDHDHDAHDHPGHDEANAIEMSVQARKNIGLTVETIALKPFTKTIDVPGIVVERPGRSVVKVTALMTGVVTRIYPIEGQAVEPGQRLFDMRMTHEELVQSQGDLLQTAEELEVNDSEIKRIEALTANGAIARKQLIERQYERQKLQVVLRSKRQALLLHGLTDEQIDGILESHQLLREVSIAAPQAENEGMSIPSDTVYQIQSVQVEQGQHVNAGDPLAVLVDHAELYIEGEAFERDMTLVSRAANEKAPIAAVIDAEGGRPQTIADLRVLYLSSTVDPSTRTQDFFVTLPNEKVRDARLEGDRRFIAWKYRPGQRVQLQIPIETLDKSIVLPIEALAQDGVETYLFAPNGDHFDRLPVHVLYRDTRWVVIANDGAVFPGDVVATSGAQQLQYALKNKSGGAIDPHAGHNH